MNNFQLKRDLDKVQDLPNARPFVIRTARDAGILIEEQEDLLRKLAEMWGGGECWQGHPEPCGECKACVTTKMLTEAGVIRPTPDGPTLFDI